MKTVMVFGTFDRLHPGHKSFFRQAKKLGDFFVVVIARDKHVKGAKGESPSKNETLRLKNVKKLGVANKTILGSRTHNFYRTVRTYKPDLIALGYDQKPSVWQLRKDLKKHRLKNIKIMRLRPYRPNIYKSSKLREYEKV